VLFDGPRHFQEEVAPALAHSVDLARRLRALDPGRGPQRLVRVLADKAMGHLVTGAYASAGDALREALDLHTSLANPTT
jgi:hypothetical protein